MRAARDSWVNPALALLLCAAVGAAFAGLRMPLPWMIGPLLAMAACNFAGARLRSPPAARALGQIIIGTALGLYFTPVVGREVSAHWWLLMA
ncbi:MAG: AbrB family transcriptional regulator, partial [Burkholderiales bacterium]